MAYGARQVPQNIMSVEFKIFDIMTLKQFGVSIVLFILCIALFSFLSFPWNFFIPTFILIVGGIIIFVPFNGEPFQEFLSSYMEAMISPQRRIWHKKGIVLKSAMEKARYYRYGNESNYPEKMNNLVFSDMPKKSADQKKLDQQEKSFLKAGQFNNYNPPAIYRDFTQSLGDSSTVVSQKSLENTADLSSLVEKNQLNSSSTSTIQNTSDNSNPHLLPSYLKKEHNSGSNATFEPKLSSEQEETAVRNFIFGSVEGYDGNPIKGAAIVLKNTKDETLEVLYSDSVGEFKSNYEYIAGKYIILVNADSKDFNQVVFDHNPVDPKPILILPKDYTQKISQEQYNDSYQLNSTDNEGIFTGNYDPNMFSLGQDYFEENRTKEEDTLTNDQFVQKSKPNYVSADHESITLNSPRQTATIKPTVTNMMEQTSNYSLDALNLFEQMSNNRMVNDYSTSDYYANSNDLQQTNGGRTKIINDVEIHEFEAMPNALVPFEQNLVSLPNTINGILVDPHGYGLANALIRVFNKNGELVTSMNSDNTGRFYTYSPLPNDDYVFYISKNGQNLAGLSVNLNGNVIPPKIISFTY